MRGRGGSGAVRSRGRGRSRVPEAEHDAAPRPGAQHNSGRPREILEQARLCHAAASKKALNLAASEMYESSSDEDDLDGDEILKKLFKDYKGAGIGDANCDDAGSFATNQYLNESFLSGAITCLVCISSVKRQEAVWNCCGCFATFHLWCIQRWVREGIARKSVLSDDHFPNKECPWFCPKCRYEFQQHQCPSKYFCYCGKIQDPLPDPWLMPHSCGTKCERSLRPECGHKCLLLCHPGPCPPCPKMVMKSCLCGKMPRTARRCGATAWSCGQICETLLPCGKHKCKMNCHEGDCPSCPYTSRQLCNCGKNQRDVPCASPIWKCEQECKKELLCGVHQCQKICHSGKCGQCPRSGWRTCPCGKIGTGEFPCVDDIPTCEDTCGKSLGCCGGHKCMRRCHHGPCGPCSIIMEKQCRCGKRKKLMPCFKEFACEIKCQKMRDCGNHQCKRKCCDGQCSRCEQVCGRTLQCKNHKCQSTCHQGRCYPCILSCSVLCNCGKTSITVVCGKERATKPPRCKLPCNMPSSCHHPSRQLHHCHFGPCRNCSQICGITMDCGHNCPEKCHDEVLVKNEVKAVGPWELTYKSETVIKRLPCPPCRYPVLKCCLGDHDSMHLPCFEATRYCCGRPCGRLLRCKNHNCTLPCHTVENAVGSIMAGENCTECQRPCCKRRPEGCSHDCPLPCHPGPCGPCKGRIRKRCHCGIVLLHHKCQEWCLADDAVKLKMESCGNNCPKQLSCGHNCVNLCHSGSCPGPEMCKKKMTLKCPCKRKKREFLCPEVQNCAKVVCDAICKEIKKRAEDEKEETLRKEADEREEAERREIEKFDRMMLKSSKSRRKRRVFRKEDDGNISFFQNTYFKYGTVVVAIAVLAAYAYNFVQVSL